MPKQKSKHALVSPKQRRSNEFANNQVVYNGLSIFDDMIMTASEAKTEDKVQSSLEDIVEYISHPEKLELVSNTQYQHLFTLLYQNLFHEIQDPPDSVIYSDVAAVYSCPFFKYLNLVHRIILQILNKANLKSIEIYFTRSFIERLVLMLRAPSLEEQTSTEKVINAVYQIVPHQKMVIFSAMAHLLEGYRDGVFTYFCVSPALRFFLSFFQKTQLFNKKTFALFRNTIFALFSTPFISNFSSLLNQVSIVFFSRDPLIANWCIMYLLRHWPNTAANKEVIFISQISSICNYFRAQTNEKLAIRTIRQIGCCINSNNFKVSQAALDFVKDDKFCDAFEQLSETYYPILLPKIKDATRHWSCDVRELASNVTKILYSQNQSLTTKVVTSMDIRVHQSLETKQGWGIVAEAAKMADSSIDISNIC